MQLAMLMQLYSRPIPKEIREITLEGLPSIHMAASLDGSPYGDISNLIAPDQIDAYVHLIFQLPKRSLQIVLCKGTLLIPNHDPIVNINTQCHKVRFFTVPGPLLPVLTLLS